MTSLRLAQPAGGAGGRCSSPRSPGAEALGPGASAGPTAQAPAGGGTGQGPPSRRGRSSRRPQAGGDAATVPESRDKSPPKAHVCSSGKGAASSSGAGRGRKPAGNQLGDSEFHALARKRRESRRRAQGSHTRPLPTARAEEGPAGSPGQAAGRPLPSAGQGSALKIEQPGLVGLLQRHRSDLKRNYRTQPRGSRPGQAQQRGGGFWRGRPGRLSARPPLSRKPRPAGAPGPRPPAAAARPATSEEVSLPPGPRARAGVPSRPGRLRAVPWEGGCASPGGQGRAVWCISQTCGFGGAGPSGARAQH